MGEGNRGGVRIGLALSGGGARGLAHVGVLKVLEEARLPVHMLAGTSMGGVVGAAYAAGRSAAEIEALICSLKLLDIVHRDRSGMGLLGQEKIADRVRDALGGDLTFDQLRLPLALVTVDIERGDEVVIREGSVVDAVLASSAVPVVFPPRRYQGRWLVDGGLLNPVPFDVVRDMGADRVIAVHTRRSFSDELGAEQLPEGRGAEAVLRALLHRSRWATLVDISERSSSIASIGLIEHRLEKTPPDVMIEVQLSGVGLLDMDQAERCQRAGEEAARRYLPELIALRDGRLSLLARLSRWWRSAASGLAARRGRESGEADV